MKRFSLILLLLLVVASVADAWADFRPVTATLQNAATATGNGSALTVDGFSSAGVQVTITNTATVTFEATQDLSTWQALVCTLTSSTSVTLATTATATGTYQCDVAGMVQMRARISAYTSGSVTVTATASPGVTGKGSGGGGSSASVGTVGAAAPSSATQICGTDGTNCTVPKVITTAPGSSDPGIVVRNVNPNLAADNSSNSSSKVPVIIGTVSTADPTFTNGNQAPISLTTTGYGRFQLPGGTASNAGNASGISPVTASYVYSFNLCGVSTTWSACTASGVVDAANNAAAPANVQVIGFEANSGASQPTAATTGNVRRGIVGLDGVQYVRPGGPVLFHCSATGIAGTLTQLTNCGAPGAGLSYYITSIVAGSTTATAGNFLLRYGTAANCGTGTTSIFPQAETTVVGFLPANTATPFTLMFPTPYQVPANNLICVIGVTTNTVRIDVAGFIAP